MEHTYQKAIFAGGCFWGFEKAFQSLPGVISTAVGYTGGMIEHPSYEQVCTGATHHAEAVEIIFDPAQISYEALLNRFFGSHEPTTLNRQHNDIGTQYRSAIFYHSDEQRAQAEEFMKRAQAKFSSPIVTALEPATEFWKAEEYHQKYLEKNPGGYNCHIPRNLF